MKIYIVIGFLFCSLFSFSQEVKAEKLWTLEECIAFAKEKSITVKSVALTLESAQVNYEKSKSMRLPNLMGNL